MGLGSYSSTTVRNSKMMEKYEVSDMAEYTSLDNNVLFKQKNINNAMNPNGVKVREARDSAEHPESVAIIIGLDVTGSMGSVPNYLVKEGLPKIMEKIIQSGIKDPQVLFLGIGDHEYDSSPLQISQFESNDDMLDKWLGDVYLEGGGGCNPGESYHLAWYFAGQHTAIDCFEKRKQKGFLFTIGDEPVLKQIPKTDLQKIMGEEGQYQDYSADQLLAKARELYNVYHIHVRETSAGSRGDTIDKWKQLLSDHVLIADRHEDISNIISQTIIKDAIAANMIKKENLVVDKPKEEMML